MASRVLPRTIEVKHLAGNRSWGAANACCQRTDNRGHLVNIRAAIAMGINQREKAIAEQGFYRMKQYLALARSRRISCQHVQQVCASAGE